MSEDGKKRKRGRPKGPCNAKELAQRRGAAWKHGGRATSVLRKAVHPCREDLCPLEFPCSLRTNAEEAGRAVEVCLVTFAADPKVQDAYLKAIQGDQSALGPLVAQTLASGHQLLARQLGDLLEHGFALTEDVVSKEGEVLGERRVPNPAASPTLRLMELMGATAAQQAVTPKSTAKRGRERAETNMLTWLAGKRAAGAGR